MTEQESVRKSPKLVAIDQVSDGWIKKYVLTYEKEGGETFTYESVSRKGLAEYTEQLEANAAGLPPKPDAVCIYPILPNDSILLLREFRYPLNAWCVALPAGLIEEGEPLEETINRELLEETGCRLRTDLEGPAYQLLPQSGFSSTGMGEENVQVAIAYVERVGDQHLGENELIETFELPREEIGTFLNTNTAPIGTRCQLLLEASRRLQVLKKRMALAQNPLTKHDFA
ncbi:MAG: NUDIX hydrolase [Eggerthellaceae bacterium]|nr:NUDIX hydrolase [Eggerthellaceae bacterium]